LPEPHRVTEICEGVEVSRHTREFTVDLPEHVTRVFYLD
jgi:hypothetical protein